MRIIFAALVYLYSLPALTDDEFLEDFLIGKYTLIGKAINSNDTYAGKIEINKDGEGLSVIRKIDGEDVLGKGVIESALNGDAKVLRIRFSQNGKDFEETCLFQGDLDNYPRITCYLYQQNADTKDPGLEALFPDHSAE